MNRPLALTAAIASSLLAQRFLALSGVGWWTASGLLFGAAAALAVWALASLYPSSKGDWMPLPARSLVGGSSGMAPWWRGTVLISALALYSASLATYKVGSGPSAALWGASMGLFALAFLPIPGKLRLPRLGSSSAALEIGAVVVLVGLAAALRLWRLTDIPAFVHGDEAEIGLGAREVLAGERGLFSVGWYQYPQMTFALPGLVMALAGDDLFGLRLASVLFGLLTIVFFYLLVRDILGKRVAFLATFFLAVSYAFIHTSRIGEHYGQAPLFEVLSLFLFVRGLKTGRLWYYALAGLSVGIGMQLYYAYRIVPFLMAAFALYLALARREVFRTAIPGLVVLVAGSAVALGPMGLFFLEHQETFVSRTREVLIFNEGSRAHFYAKYGTLDAWDVARIQVSRSLLAFNLFDDTSTQYGFRMPILDFWMAALFVPGLALAMYRWREPGHLLCSLWFWAIVLSGGVLTIDPPFLPRLVGILPVLTIFPALIVEGCWQWTARYLPGQRLRLMAPVLAAFLALVAYTNAQRYFGYYISQSPSVPVYTAIAKYVRDLPPDSFTYLLSISYPMLFDYGTIRFIAPEARGKHVNDPDAQLPASPSGLPEGAVFVMIPGDADYLDEIEGRYPGGQMERHLDQQGRLLFVSYSLTR